MFKLVRMEELRETDIEYTKKHNVTEINRKVNSENRDNRNSREKTVHVRLYGKACIKAKCREYLNGRITREYENGDFEFCFSAPEHETFWFGVILSFGNKTKILEPQELKERIVNTCREIQVEYESRGTKNNITK